MTKAVSVHVTGRVQGVGFRYHAVEEGRRLGVTGWVRNEPDESVAGHVEGDEAAVDAFVSWCRRGPASAVVRHVAVTEARLTGAQGFDVRY